jgi:predicted porin
MVGPVRVGLGWIHRLLQGDVRSVKTDVEYLGAAVLYGAWQFDVQVSHIGNAADQADGTLGVLRANYLLSKRTAVYGVAGYMKNHGKGAIYSASAGTAVPAAPFGDSNQMGFELGIRQTF